MTSADDRGLDVPAWLDGLGLSRYRSLFADHEITGDILAELSDANLRELGLPLGPRKRLLVAIRALAEAPAPSAVVQADGRRAPDEMVGTPAERRQITVMFCDLVGSTVMAARLDPEDMREVISAYHDCVDLVVGQHGGSVAQHLGDGAMVYFGYPQADEHAAERAVRAGFALIEAVAGLSTQVGRLEVRIGVATGMVVVGDLLGLGNAHERLAVGRTPNLAARLQAMGGPGQVVIDPNTRLLIGRLFDCASMGRSVQKGFAEPLQVWRVTGESAVASRFEALRGDLEPLVGRESELGLLTEAWARATEGEGGVRLLSGEAGIGKSRLVAAFEERLDGGRHRRQRFFCSPHHRNSALHPFIREIEREAMFENGDTPQSRRLKLERLLGAEEVPEGDAALIADLLSLPARGDVPAAGLTPEQRKLALFEALLRRQERLARSRSLLVILEDMHWIDPTSRQLLAMMVERAAALPLLLIVTQRPGEQPAWAEEPDVAPLALQRLARAESCALTHAVAGDRPLHGDVVAEILDRTDGIPLFIEEMTKAVVEAAGSRRDPLSLPAAVPAAAQPIPMTLHASLMSRLDRLSTRAKAVAQAGAAIGREFSGPMLAASAGIGQEAAETGLAELIQAGLVLRCAARAAAPEAAYGFKHALVQDAAYGTLLRPSRRALHGRIAAALREQRPEIGEAQPELLAHHHAEAGMVAQAVELLRRAGDRSFARSATAEAVTHFRAALRHLSELPESADKRSDTIRLQLGLGRALRAAKGAAASETGDAFRAAYDMAVAAGDHEHVPEALDGLLRSFQNRGDSREAHRLATLLQSFGRDTGDDDAVLRGLEMRGMAAVMFGSFDEARSDLEAAVAAYRGAPPERPGSSEPPYTLMYLAWLLFAMGLPDQARAREDEGVAAAAGAGPIVAGYSMINACYLDQMTGDWRSVRGRAEAAIAWGGEKGLPVLVRVGRLFLGWALAEAGEPSEGLALVGDFLEDSLTTETLLELPYSLAIIAEVYMRAGRLDEAVALLDRALATVGQTGERWFEAELHRLRGAYIRLADPVEGEPQAERSFRHGLAVAQEQGALMWELRCAAGLATLLRGGEGHTEARGLLASALSRFTEGFGTQDVKDARALLDAMG